MSSKDKGNAFERKMSKLLSERFFEITGIKESFRRNIDSGSYFGGKNQSRVNVYDTSKATFGDIMVPEGFKFSIECKHYKDAPSFSMITKQDYKQWEKWISQATQDSESSGLDFMLIIKYNNVDELVIVKNRVEIDYTLKYKDYYVYTLENFLKLDDTIFFS